MGRCYRLILACMMLLLVPLSAVAQEMKFPRGSFTLTTDLTYAHTFDDVADIPAMQVGFNYFVFDNISIGGELTGYGVFQEEGDDAVAVGFSLVVRHHFLRWDRASLFADASFGPFEANTDVPPTGTRFNYVTRAGLGMTYELDPDLYLYGGAHYFHLSNARLEGVEHNPQMNGVEFYFGLMWPL